MLNHYLLEEWDDLHVNAGRLAEATLRIIEWHVLNGHYTPIDGKSKPNRSKMLSLARNTSNLPLALRLQIPCMIELLLDFRNNRNSAHLGGVNPSKIDGAMVMQTANWIVGEICRINGVLPTERIQDYLDGLASRPIPVIHEINGRPLVLSIDVNMTEDVLLMLYSTGSPQATRTLFKWSGHGHITRWKAQVLTPLSKKRLVYIEDGMVYLLPTGVKKAEEIIRRERVALDK